MLEHLDNRKMVIKPPAGAIVRPETLQGVPHVMCVPDEGMPRKGAPFEKGRLFVLFTIKFPDNYSLGDEQVSVGRWWVVVGGGGWWLGRRRRVGRARHRRVDRRITTSNRQLPQVALLKQALPPALNHDAYDPEETEEHRLEDIDIKDFGKIPASDGYGEEEEDEGPGGPGGPGGPQCQQS